MGGSADLVASTNVKGNDGNFGKDNPLGKTSTSASGTCDGAIVNE